MTKQTQYQQLKAAFATYGSWALWNVMYQINHDLSIQHQDLDIAPIRQRLDHDPAYLEKQLCFDAVFVGLNWAGTGNACDDPWETFHDPTNTANKAGKAARILMPSRFRGCYMTDLIKNYCQTDSSSVIKDLKQPENRDILEQSIHQFLTELDIVQPNYLILSGRPVANLYQFAVKTCHLTDMPRIIHIPHYSSALSKQDCRYLTQRLNQRK